jgi:hypothetical protein
MASVTSCSQALMMAEWRFQPSAALS